MDRKMRIRRTIGTLTLGAALVAGCDTDVSAPETSATGTIRGTVTVGASPVIGAAVTAKRGSFSLARNTGADETFTIGGLRPGDYTVQAGASGLSCEARGVRLAAGQTAVADIRCTVSSELSRAGIYVADADGSGATWLARGLRPAWSPDGRHIAFDRGGRIHVMEANGENERPLARGVDPAWSPDGTRIVFADGEGGISVMHADGSAVTRLIADDFAGSSGSLGVGKPAWSPDGKRIAFNHLGDGEVRPARIYVMNADGSDPRRLTFSEGVQYAESDPEWSPGGSRIVFWSFGHGIATVDPDDLVPPRTVYAAFPFVHYGAKPDWSPGDDRTGILFTADRTGRGSGPFLYHVDIFLADMGAGPPRLLVPGGYDPAWSPDGRRFAFVFGLPDG